MPQEQMPRQIDLLSTSNHSASAIQIWVSLQAATSSLPSTICLYLSVHPEHLSNTGCRARISANLYCFSKPPILDIFLFRRQVDKEVFLCESQEYSEIR